MLFIIGNNLQINVFNSLTTNHWDDDRDHKHSQVDSMAFKERSEWLETPGCEYVIVNFLIGLLLCILPALERTNRWIEWIHVTSCFRDHGPTTAGKWDPTAFRIWIWGGTVELFTELPITKALCRWSSATAFQLKIEENVKLCIKNGNSSKFWWAIKV